MGNVVFVSLSLLVLCFSQIYVWSKLYDKKISFKNFYLYVSLLIMFIFGMFNYFYVNVLFRMIILMFLFSICNYIVFKKKINETIVSTVYGQLLLTVSDVLCSLLVIIIFGVSYESIREGVLFKCFGNILISICFLLLAKFPFVKLFYLKLVGLTEKIRFNNLIIVCLLVIISMNFLMVSTFYEVGSIFVIAINSILILVYSFIIYLSINEKNKSLIVQAENEYLIENLHQYEDMVDRQRVDNHENKNQLLIIKNMINKNDKDVVKYIDTIVKDQKEDDEALYTKVKTIPSGGLQGIIYQKMLVMKDEKILFSLDVSRDVRKVDLDNFSMEDNYRLCKIIGVFLDNAIEESRNIDDKRIMISLYVDDDNLVVDISNKFNGKIELDRLDDEGYTTKSDGHGYGLSLVKKILSETDKFENERSIRKDIFKQTIKVKIKNT